jgi:hypothetical protein
MRTERFDRRRSPALLILALAAFTVMATVESPAYVAGMTLGPVHPRSFSRLAFGPQGILFVGDSIGAQVFALDLGDRTPHAATTLRVDDIEGKIATLVGADPRDVLIHDMAVNPISKNTYLTVSTGRRRFVSQWQLPNEVADAGALIRVTPNGSIEEVRLDHVEHSTALITNPASAAATSDQTNTSKRVDVISDMAFADGKLFVAGLSNEEFSSALRIYAFPFAGGGSSTSLEIYHGSHGQYETESPIRSFLPMRLHGKPYLLAAYLCTPVALFPLDDLKDRQHVKGTTIGEMGDGNYPLDMVAFRLKERDYVLMVNSARGLLLIRTDDLERPLPPITRPITGTSGLPAEHLRNLGVLHAENYGDAALLFMIRNPLDGVARLATAPLGDLQ